MSMAPSPRRQAAIDYMGAAAALADTTRTLEAPAPSWWRPLHRARYERVRAGARRALESARAEMMSTEARLVNLGAGAGAEWGLLSRLPHGATAAEHLLFTLMDDRATALRQTLPHVRAQVELGTGASALAAAEQATATLAATFPALRDFLPVYARPLAATAAELERSTPLITMLVTDQDEDWDDPVRHIRLHDIVSHARGAGLGTAALQELCAHADRRQLPISADFVAGYTADAAATVRLAAWYYRHGFRQGTRLPEDWVSPAPMRREPQ